MQRFSRYESSIFQISIISQPICTSSQHDSLRPFFPPLIVSQQRSKSQTERPIRYQIRRGSWLNEDTITKCPKSTKISSKENNEKGNFFPKTQEKSPRSSNAHHVPPKSPARSAAQAASLLPRTATVSPSASLSAHPSTPGSSNVLSRLRGPSVPHESAACVNLNHN